MREQVADGDRPRGLLERYLLGAALCDQHLAAELRQVPFDRVLDRQLALVHEDHDAQGGNRLGHGGDAEEGVLGHRLLAGQVQAADGLVADDAVLPADDRDGAGDVVLVHERLHAVADRGHFAGVRLRASGRGEDQR